MEIKAQLKFLRLSPRKVRSVLKVIHNLSLKEAEAQLLLLNKRAAQPVLKLLFSAIANAKNEYSLRKEDLKIKKIEVQEGPTLDRWFPRAFGRAAPIKKRSSHLLIVLEPQKGVPVVKKTESLKPKKVQKIISREDLRSKPDVESDKAKKGVDLKKKEEESKQGPRPKTGGGSFIKKVLRRKTI